MRNRKQLPWLLVPNSVYPSQRQAAGKQGWTGSLGRQQGPLLPLGFTSSWASPPPGPACGQATRSLTGIYLLQISRIQGAHVPHFFSASVIYEPSQHRHWGQKTSEGL